jgi:glycosyltransferase involved in cell wall biosynthesis
MKSVDVIVATHNRAGQIPRLLESIRNLRGLDRIKFSLLVCANACTDTTVAVVKAFSETVSFDVVVLEEARPGKSYALNRALERSTADWVAFFDDDETVDAGWFDAFSRLTERPGIDFFAGRYVAEFELPPPSWLPSRHTTTVLSRHDDETPEQAITRKESLFWGGNCAISRQALNVVKSFQTDLGRASGLNALGCEDVDMQLRLLAAGFSGVFSPELTIHHWTPKERVSKKYFRDKIFWAGHGQRRYRQLDPTNEAPPPRLLGIERWRFRIAVGALFGMAASAIMRNEPTRFAFELDLWQFWGYVSACIAEKRASVRHSLTEA